MNIINISAYKFIPLFDTEYLRDFFYEALGQIGLKGTVIFAFEGINIGLAGTREQIEKFSLFLKYQARFKDIEFKISPSSYIPFRHLKIKLKKQLVPGGDDQSCPLNNSAPKISPQELKSWYENKTPGKDFILIDTRNDYEFEMGSFEHAIHYDLEKFRDIDQHFLKLAQENSEKNSELLSKPIVTFCTGGIRCERGAPLAKVLGLKNVYQLDGGILNYFKDCGGAFWRGSCFVFDERRGVTPDLLPA